jgi:hypothetical protein
MAFDKKSKKARESINKTLVFVANGIHNDSIKWLLQWESETAKGEKRTGEDIG